MWRSVRSALAALASLAAAGGGAALAQSTGSVDLVWNSNVEPDLAGYRLFAHTDPNVYSMTPAQAAAVARTTSVGPSGAPTVTATVANLTITTWFFAVTALDQSGNESGFSNVVSATPDVTPVVRTVSPSAAEQGTTGLAVTISGSNFASGSTVGFGPDIAVSSVNASGAPTTLVATIDVGPLAQVVSRTVTVTSPGGSTGSRASSFTVTLDVGRLDIDGSNRIDNGDLVEILLGFPAVVGDGIYSTDHDLDVDGKVDGADLAIFFTNFGLVGPF